MSVAVTMYVPKVLHPLQPGQIEIKNSKEMFLIKAMLLADAN